MWSIYTIFSRILLDLKRLLAHTKFQSQVYWLYQYTQAHSVIANEVSKEASVLNHLKEQNAHTGKSKHILPGMPSIPHIRKVYSTNKNTCVLNYIWDKSTCVCVNALDGHIYFIIHFWKPVACEKRTLMLLQSHKICNFEDIWYKIRLCFAISSQFVDHLCKTIFCSFNSNFDLW